MTYSNLNQAAATNPALAEGKTKIWYFKNEAGRDMMMGHSFCKQYGLLPKVDNLEATHTLIGSIASTDCDEIYMAMQGENWSPQGEARDLLRSKGLGHTSMSMGDIAEINGKFFFVDSFGFKELN